MKVGKTKTEKLVESITVSRNIVKEIIEFGTTDAQRIDIIHFLALELESREALEKITNVTKNLRKTINQDEKSEYNEKDVITDNCNNKLIGV
jgi:mannitol/fructose-specific phosphotransferase system IIA component (Ntr-type)